MSTNLLPPGYSFADEEEKKKRKLGQKKQEPSLLPPGYSFAEEEEEPPPPEPKEKPGLFTRAARAIGNALPAPGSMRPPNEPEPEVGPQLPPHGVAPLPTDRPSVYLPPTPKSRDFVGETRIENEPIMSTAEAAMKRLPPTPGTATPAPTPAAKAAIAATPKDVSMFAGRPPTAPVTTSGLPGVVGGLEQSAEAIEGAADVALTGQPPTESAKAGVPLYPGRPKGWAPTTEAPPNRAMGEALQQVLAASDPGMLAAGAGEVETELPTGSVKPGVPLYRGPSQHPTTTAGTPQSLRALADENLKTQLPTGPVRPGTPLYGGGIGKQPVSQEPATEAGGLTRIAAGAAQGIASAADALASPEVLALVVATPAVAAMLPVKAASILSGVVTGKFGYDIAKNLTTERMAELGDAIVSKDPQRITSVLTQVAADLAILIHPTRETEQAAEQRWRGRRETQTAGPAPEGAVLTPEVFGPKGFAMPVPPREWTIGGMIPGAIAEAKNIRQAFRPPPPPLEEIPSYNPPPPAGLPGEVPPPEAGIVPTPKPEPIPRTPGGAIITEPPIAPPPAPPEAPPEAPPAPPAPPARPPEPVAPRAAGGSWRPEIRVGNEWRTDPHRFATEQEAEDYAVLLMKRSLVSGLFGGGEKILEARGAHSDEPVTHAFPHGPNARIDAEPEPLAPPPAPPEPVRPPEPPPPPPPPPQAIEGPRWTRERRPKPGEPIAYLDGKDAETAKAAIIEVEPGQFEAWTGDGTLIGQFTDKNEAAKAAEAYADKPPEPEQPPAPPEPEQPPAGEIKPEPHEITPEPEHVGGPRWMQDRGAMPGEPMAYLDLDENTGDTKAIILEKEDEPGQGAHYEAWTSDGILIGKFTDANDAAKAAETFVDQPEPPREIDKRTELGKNPPTDEEKRIAEGGPHDVAPPAEGPEKAAESEPVPAERPPASEGVGGEAPPKPDEGAAGAGGGVSEPEPAVEGPVRAEGPPGGRAGGGAEDSAGVGGWQGELHRITQRRNAEIIKAHPDPVWGNEDEATTERLRQIEREMEAAQDAVVAKVSTAELAKHILSSAELEHAANDPVGPYKGDIPKNNERGGRIPAAIELEKRGITRWDQLEGAAKGETAKPAPVELGNVSVVNTEKFPKVRTRFGVVSAMDLVVSHDPHTLKENPAYPQEYQGRDRTRFASDEQVRNRLNTLDPEQLAENPLAQHGAPIVGSDLIVESGNGRVMAIRRGYDSGHEKTKEYRAWLEENAERFGLDPERVKGIEDPVLVRVRETDVDRSAFAADANKEAVAEMSPTEQALADAKGLTPKLMEMFHPNEDGDFTVLENRPFLAAFVKEVIGPAGAGKFMDKQGLPNKALIDRVKNAVLGKAYKEPEVVAMLTEAIDVNIRNVGNALTLAAPAFARMQQGIEAGELHPLDISPNVVEAAQLLSSLKREGKTVEQFLLQGADIFGQSVDPITARVLEYFHKNRRSARKIASFLEAYAAAVEAAGDARQNDIFGTGEKPTIKGALDVAFTVAAEEAGADTQTGQLDFGEGEQPGLSGGVGEKDKGGAGEAPAAEPGPEPVGKLKKRAREKAEAEARRAEHFKPGTILVAGKEWGGRRDRVVAYHPGTAEKSYTDWSVDVQEIDKDGNPIGYVRHHSTEPDWKEIERAKPKAEAEKPLTKTGAIAAEFKDELEKGNWLLKTPEGRVVAILKPADLSQAGRDFRTFELVRWTGDDGGVMPYSHGKDYTFRKWFESRFDKSLRYRKTGETSRESETGFIQTVAADAPYLVSPEDAKKNAAFEAEHRGLKARIDARVDAINKAAGDAPLVVFEKEGAGQRVLSRSTDPDALPWRVTRFDERGPAGHIEYKTREEAIRELAREHFEVTEAKGAKPPATIEDRLVEAGVPAEEAKALAPNLAAAAAEWEKQGHGTSESFIQNMLDEMRASAAPREVPEGETPGGGGVLGLPDEGPKPAGPSALDFARKFLQKKAGAGQAGNLEDSIGKVRDGGTTPGEPRRTSQGGEGQAPGGRGETGPGAVLPPPTDAVGGGHGGPPGGAGSVERPKPDAGVSGRAGAGEGPVVPHGDERGGPNGPSGGAGEVPAPGGGGGPVPNAPPEDGGDSARLSGANPGLNVGDTGLQADTGELTEATYENYKPQRVSIEGMVPHPTKLVESAAMASVMPPEYVHELSIPQELIRSGKPSDAQLEAAMMAGAAHDKLLPDGTRRAALVGDGTGVGKGLEIATVILDNWNKGRRRHLWITQDWKLLKDAQRDLKALGMDPNLLISMEKFPVSKPIPNRDGIVFTCYSSIRGGARVAPQAGGGVSVAPRTRITQLVEWLNGELKSEGAQALNRAGRSESSGVVAFDEAHNMGNAGADPMSPGGSAQAKAGLDLQKALPNARILFSSATGATEISNLAFAGQRLGLWGEGTAFRSREDFMSQVGESGLAGMEVIARDMKALGVYIARNLSYDGVNYEHTVHELDEKQVVQYDESVRAWRRTLEDLRRALELTALNHAKVVDPKTKMKAMSLFYGTQLMYFDQVATAMKIPTQIKEMEASLAKGNAPLFSFINTNDAAMQRQLDELEENANLDDLDFTPREAFAQYITKHFPVIQMKDEYDPATKKWTMMPQFNPDGSPKLNPQAVALRDALVAHLEKLDVPPSPLDALISHFGPEQFSEVTGRSKRVVKLKNGQTVIQKRNPKEDNLADIKAFQDDEKRILGFSTAGGTGESYHADLNAKNQRVRDYWLTQMGYRANVAMQQMGRPHRANQKQPPVIHLLTTNLPGEKRFSATMARRLEQMGALGRGERKSASQGLFTELDNLESSHARDALRRFIRDLVAGDIDGLSARELQSQIGLRLVSRDGGPVSRPPDMDQFLNRLLALEVATQNRVFDAFFQRFKENIELAIESGTLDTGVENLKAEKVEKTSEQTVYTHPESKAETKYMTLDVNRKHHIIPFPEEQRSSLRFVKNRKSGHVWALDKTPITRVDKEGNTIIKYRMIGPAGTEFIDKKDLTVDPAMYAEQGYSRFFEVAPDVAKKKWEEQAAELPEFRTIQMHFITGAILPIWDKLSGKDVRVMRVKLADGQKLLGRLIPTKELDETLRRLGAKKPKIVFTPKQLYDKVLGSRYHVALDNGWKVTRRVANGKPRVELEGPGPGDLAELKGDGVTYERIQFKPRFAVPSAEVLAKVIGRHPVAESAPPKETGVLGKPGAGGPRQRTTMLAAISATKAQAREDGVTLTDAEVKEIARRARAEVQRGEGGEDGSEGGGAAQAQAPLEPRPPAAFGKTQRDQRTAGAAARSAGGIPADSKAGVAGQAPGGVKGAPTGSRPQRATMVGGPKVFVTAPEIIEHLQRLAGTPIRIGHGRFAQRKAAGWFDPDNDLIRMKVANDIDTAAHEVGHSIDERLNAADYSHMPKGARSDLDRLGRELYGTRQPTGGGYMTEGWAEYIAQRVRGENVASSAPDIHRWFENEFLPKHPELKEGLDKAQVMFDEWDKQGAAARVAAQIHNIARTPTEKIKDAWTRAQAIGFRRLFTSYAAPLEDAVARAMVQNPDIDITPESNPAIVLAALAMGAKGTAKYTIFDHTVNIKGEPTGDSLADVLRPIKDRLDEFVVYGVARRAQVLHDRNINPGITKGDADFVVESLKCPEYDAAVDGLTAWSDRLLDYLVESGGLSREAARIIRLLNPIYMPFQRYFEESYLGGSRGQGTGRGNVNLPKAIRKIKGSGRQTQNPLEVFVQQAERLIALGNKAQVGVAIAEFAEKMPGLGWFANKVPPPVEATTFKIEDIKKQLEKAGVNLEDADLEQLITVFHAVPRFFGKDNIVSIWRGGKREFWELHPDVYRVVTDMDREFIVPWLLAAPKRMVQLGATGINVGFSLISNPLRDAMTWNAYDKGHHLSPFGAFTGLWDELQKDPAAQRWKALGGEMGTLMGQDRAAARRHLEEALASGFHDKAWITLKHPIDGLREGLGIFESGPRIATFKSALERAERKYGVNSRSAFLEALYESKDVTVNFTRVGTFSRAMNQMVPFFNARIQGASKFYRTFGGGQFPWEPKTSKAYMAMKATRFCFEWITVPSLLLWMLNKDEDWYRELKPYEKGAFWVFSFDHGKHKYRIPKPQELGYVFGTVPEALLDYAYRGNKRGVMDALWGTVDSLLPFSLSQGVQGLLDVLPAAIKPVVEYGANIDTFRNHRIVDAWQEERKVPIDQYHKYTTATAIALGQAFNVSPAKLEHVIGSYTGGTGLSLMQGIDLLTGARKKKPIESLADVPVLSRFALRNTPGVSVDDLYDRVKELEQKRGSHRLTLREGVELKHLEQGKRAITDMRHLIDDGTVTKEDGNQKITKIARDALRLSPPGVSHALPNRGLLR